MVALGYLNGFPSFFFTIVNKTEGGIYMAKPHLEFYFNDVLMPGPSDVSDKRNKIWSDNTGRAVTAKMIGDILAKKKEFSINWKNLTKSQVDLIESNLSTVDHPFIKFSIRNSETAEDYVDIMIYDGVLSASWTPRFYHGEPLFKDIKAELVEQ